MRRFLLLNERRAGVWWPISTRKRRARVCKLRRIARLASSSEQLVETTSKRKKKQLGASMAKKARASPKVVISDCRRARRRACRRARRCRRRFKTMLDRANASLRACKLDLATFWLCDCSSRQAERRTSVARIVSFVVVFPTYKSGWSSGRSTASHVDQAIDEKDAILRPKNSHAFERLLLLNC